MNKMLSLFKWTILVVCFSLTLKSCKSQEKISMKKYQFIPKQFEEVSYNYRNNNLNLLTPFYNEIKKSQDIPPVIRINAPVKVIYNEMLLNNLIPTVLPICGCGMFFERRGLYYYPNNNYYIHIKPPKKNEWIVGEVVIPEYEEGELPISLYEEETEEQTKSKEATEFDLKIKEVKQYSLNELDQGLSSSLDIFNYNVLDFMKLQMISGVYEIYVTCIGLESNHVKIEVVVED